MVNHNTYTSKRRDKIQRKYLADFDNDAYRQIRLESCLDP